MATGGKISELRDTVAQATKPLRDEVALKAQILKNKAEIALIDNSLATLMWTPKDRAKRAELQELRSALVEQTKTLGGRTVFDDPRKKLMEDLRKINE